MKIIKPEDRNKLPFEFSAIKRIERDDLVLVELDLNEGQRIDLHGESCIVVFYVKDGNAYFLHEEGKIQVEKGDVITVNPNEMRGWICENGQQISLLVIKLMH